MTRKFLPTLGVILALGIGYACGSDRATAPAGQSSHGSTDLNRGSRVDHDIDPAVQTVVALKRSLLLARDVSQTAVIGPGGGMISIAAAGVTVVFPPGALRARTSITLTAKAGWDVAYEFAPHGITFAAPVMIQQDLKYTQARSARDAKNVQAGYYPENLGGIFLDDRRSIARVSELRSVDLDYPPNPHVAWFYIRHFSGYLMSEGIANGVGGIDSLP
jgi:hypothetical protein